MCVVPSCRGGAGGGVRVHAGGRRRRQVASAVDYLRWRSLWRTSCCTLAGLWWRGRPLHSVRGVRVRVRGEGEWGRVGSLCGRGCRHEASPDAKQHKFEHWPCTHGDFCTEDTRVTCGQCTDPIKAYAVRVSAPAAVPQRPTEGSAALDSWSATRDGKISE